MFLPRAWNPECSSSVTKKARCEGLRARNRDTCRDHALTERLVCTHNLDALSLAELLLTLQSKRISAHSGPCLGAIRHCPGTSAGQRHAIPHR